MHSCTTNYLAKAENTLDMWWVG